LRRRLLVVGHGLRPSGYARVLEGVLPLLADAFEVTLFTLNHYGEPPPGTGDGLPYELRTNQLLGDRTGRVQLPALLSELEPDVVLLHDDTSMLPSQRAAVDEYRRARPAARAVAWCPLDWLQLPLLAARGLAAMDRLVLYSEAARIAAEREIARHGFDVPPTSVVGHGVDTGRFRPLVPGDREASRALARERLFAGRPELLDAFIVLNANLDMRRKRFEVTIDGFSEMARERPRARLHVHRSERRGERILGSPGVLDDEGLNLLYNACDVGINTAAAEGFGLVALEHAAAGAAQVVPGHGAPVEIWGDSAILLPEEPSPGDVAGALARLHDDGELLVELSARGYERARSGAFRWSTVAAHWEGLLDATLSEPRAA
jgi:D-inositol-3-phosphate glycosyltransferase